jgi:transmembrane sensor
MSFFRTGRRVRREAAEWVARLGGGAGERDHAAFRAWYEQDGRNAEAYDRMAAIWSASGRLNLSAATAPRKPANGGLWVYAIAASILIAGALAFFLRGMLPGQAGPDIVYATSRGEVREFPLPDGSRVTLDTSTRIELAFTDRERRIFLRAGRARFSVAHEQRAFIVDAGGNEVVATGTVFDVSLLENRVSVALLQGTVEVRQGRGTAARSATRLTAGNRLVLSGQAAPISLRVAPRDTSWVRQMLEFDDMPLGEVVDMANRYSNTQIRLDGEEVRALRVTGAYRAGDAAGLARGLAAAFGLQVSTDADGHLRLRMRVPAH